MSVRVEDKIFLRQVQGTIQKQGLLQDESRILIACSGGVDSLALVHALLALKDHLHSHWTLGIACVDHQIRPEGAQELEAVRHMAQDLGLPFHGAHIDVPSKARELGQSLETVGRHVRYTFLTHIALEAGYDLVAVAHHRDDQAETIMAHMVRGAGLKGLGGMAYSRSLLGRLQVIRPLLDVTKAQIRFYAEGLAYAPCEDVSNQDRTYKRNYIRHEIMPRLETLNPGVREALCRLGQSARDDESLLESLASQALERIGRYEDGRLLLERRAFRKEPKSIQRRMWNLALASLQSHKQWEWTHLEQLQHIVQSGEPKIFTANGVRVQAQCDTIEISIL